MDGIDAATAIQDLRHLREAVLPGIEHMHFRTWLGAINQRLVIGDVAFDKEDFDRLRFD
ncbi:MAG: hypothetical protein Q7U57_13460 [Methylovulum sp.]|nr:hypothetical protein [Methylovulum sp.]